MNKFLGFFGLGNPPDYPKKEWNNINVTYEKDLQNFFNDNNQWLSQIICYMFGFTTIEYLGIEYNILGKRLDMAFRHGEDIIMVELKCGYGAENSKGYYQLLNYKKIFEKKFTNKVYRVLITTHLTKQTINSYNNDNDNFGIIFLDRYFNGKNWHIKFENTWWTKNDR